MNNNAQTTKPAKCKCIRKLSPEALQRLRFELGTKAAALELEALTAKLVCDECGEVYSVSVHKGIDPNAVYGIDFRQ